MTDLLRIDANSHMEGHVMNVFQVWTQSWLVAIKTPKTMRKKTFEQVDTFALMGQPACESLR